MDEDGFTLVKGGRQAKKRKADGSPQLNSPPGASTASPTSTPARPKPSSFKNVIPVILSDVDPKLSTKVKLMSELKQFHLHIKVSKVLEKKNHSFLIIGDTPRDVAILQSETKMKACLGQNLKISLPKAYQSTQPKTTLVVKGVPAEVSEQEFKDFLDLNKINYAKAERLISRKDGRVLETFKLEIKDDTEAEALISENLTCPVTGIIYRVEEFRTPISVQQCYNCQCFGHTAKTCRSNTKCLICGEAHHHKGCPNRETKQAKCANCKGPHVASYKGCPAYKKQAFRQHVVDSQKSYASILRQNLAPPQPKDKAFTFSAEQLVKFVANVVIQVAQPQVCCANPTQDATDKKSSLCQRVSEAAKTHLGDNITGINLFDAIGQLRPSAPLTSKPKSSLNKGDSSFKFTATTKLTKPPAISKPLSPPSTTNKVVPKQLKSSK